MTQQDRPYDNTESEQRLTHAAIKDELVYQLSSKCPYEVVKNDNGVASYIHFRPKYHEQAEFILYRINTWNSKTPPVFVINTSDLTTPLYAELERLKSTSPRQFDKVVTGAVQTLLEGINKRYYHIAGLPYKVTWKFEP